MKNFRLHICVFVIYACLTAVFYHPLLPRLSDSLIGPPEDNMQFYWFLWYGAESLMKPEWPFMHTTMIYHPEGTSLYFANYFYFGVFTALLLKSWFSLALIFNLLIFFSFAASGLGAFLLAREFGAGIAAAMIGGFVYAFSPWHFAHADHHITIASIQFIPFFVLLALRAFRSGAAVTAAAAGVALALAALCDWNYLVFGLIFLGLLFVYRRRRPRAALFASDTRVLAVLGTAAFLLLAYWLVPMIRQGIGRDFAINIGHDVFVADFLGFWAPPAGYLFNTVTPIPSSRVLPQMGAWEGVVYLGWINALVVIAGCAVLRRRALGLALACLAFMGLAMGTQLHVGGHEIAMWMPYRVLTELPFLSNARSPARMMSFGMLFWAILVAVSWDVIFRQRRRMAIGLLTGVLIAADFFVAQREATPVELPACYAPIRQDEDADFAIVNLPWDGGRYMMYQTLLGKPDLQGYIGRKSGPTLIGRINYPLDRLELQKQVLVRQKVKYILFHKTRLMPHDTSGQALMYRLQIQRMITAYGRTYEKVYEDSDAAVFKVY